MSQTPSLLIAASSGRARKPTAPERPSELSPTRPFVATSSLDVAHAFLRAVSPFVATSSLDVAHAFSVPCRAFEPDISQSIVNPSPGHPLAARTLPAAVFSRSRSRLRPEP